MKKKEVFNESNHELYKKSLFPLWPLRQKSLALKCAPTGRRCAPAAQKCAPLRASGIKMRARARRDARKYPQNLIFHPKTRKNSPAHFFSSKITGVGGISNIGRQ
jgi:hypothetical protein